MVPPVPVKLPVKREAMPESSDRTSMLPLLVSEAKVALLPGIIIRRRPAFSVNEGPGATTG